MVRTRPVAGMLVVCGGVMGLSAVGALAASTGKAAGWVSVLETGAVSVRQEVDEGAAPVQVEEALGGSIHGG